jgi:phospholipid transport system substrate-binding protein
MKNSTICRRKERVLRRSKEVEFFFVLGVLFLLLVSPQLVCAALPSQSNPMALVRSGTERALRILHESQSGQAPPLRQRRDEILNIVSEYFNFEAMAKRALGRPWKEQTPVKREEFSQLFKQLLFNTYINRLENYTGSNERVLYDSEELDGDYGLVKSHVLYEGDKNVSIDYRLHRDGGKWKVYDVVVEGISFVDNYRSQFASILTNESFDSLLRRLRQKVDQSS